MASLGPLWYLLANICVNITCGVTEMSIQVNTEEAALEHFSFLRTVLEPFLESYWSIALALLKMENNMEGTGYNRVSEHMV